MKPVDGPIEFSSITIFIFIFLINCVLHVKFDLPLGKSEVQEEEKLFSDSR